MLTFADPLIAQTGSVSAPNGPDSTVRIRTTVWVPDGDSLKLMRSVESVGGPALGDSVWGTRIGGVSSTGIDAARALIVKDEVGVQLTEIQQRVAQASMSVAQATRFKPSDARESPYDSTEQRAGYWVSRETPDHVVVRTTVTELRGQLKAINTSFTKTDGSSTRLLGSVARDFANGRLIRLSVIQYDGGRLVSAR